MIDPHTRRLRAFCVATERLAANNNLLRENAANGESCYEYEEQKQEQGQRH